VRAAVRAPAVCVGCDGGGRAALTSAGRIARLEMLDEHEELDLVLDHYAVTWALSRPEDMPVDDPRWVAWETWGLHPRDAAEA
jgi:hypothetical protein